MRNLFCFILIAILLTACGSATKLSNSLKFPVDEVKAYENLTVLAFFPNKSNRAIVEDALETQFRVNGVNANSSFNAFPLAGDKTIFDKMNLDPEEFKDLIRRKVEQHKIDAVLTINLLDAQQEERYVESSRITLAAPMYTGGYPEYGYGFYDYYSYAYRGSYSTGYYETTTNYFLEINLYDMETEGIIWTGQTETKDPNSIREEAINFSKIVVAEILRLNLIKV